MPQTCSSQQHRVEATVRGQRIVGSRNPVATVPDERVVLGRGGGATMWLAGWMACTHELVVPTVEPPPPPPSGLRDPMWDVLCERPAGNDTTESLGRVDYEGVEVHTVAFARVFGHPGCNIAGRFLRAGDLDGDGFDDLVVAPFVGLRRGVLAILRGPITADRHLTDADVVWHDPSTEGEHFPSLALVPDTNGDGLPEVAIDQPSAPGGDFIRTVRLLDGLGAGFRSFDDGIATVTGSVHVERLGWYDLHGADLTGDGIGDLVATVTPNTGGVARVFPGPFEGQWASADLGFRVVQDLPRGGSGFKFATGDFTGNGSTDLVVTSGDVARVLEGPIVEDRALSQQVASIRSTAPLWATSAGDVDGDGVDDLLLWHRGEWHNYDPPAGAIWLHKGPLRGELDVEGDAAVVIRSRTEHQFPTDVHAADLDGDGTPDLLVGVDRTLSSPLRDGSGAGLVFRGPLTSTSYAGSAADLVMVGAHDHHRVGAAVSAVGDLNADGVEDFVVAASGLADQVRSSNRSPGVAYLVSGAAVSALPGP